MRKREQPSSPLAFTSTSERLTHRRGAGSFKVEPRMEQVGEGEGGREPKYHQAELEKHLFRKVCAAQASEQA